MAGNDWFVRAVFKLDKSICILDVSNLNTFFILFWSIVKSELISKLFSFISKAFPVKTLRLWLLICCCTISLLVDFLITWSISEEG